MGKQGKKDRKSMYISSDEVMDEMDNLEATVEIVGLEDLPQDDDATVVLKTPRGRKATSGDSS